MQMVIGLTPTPVTEEGLSSTYVPTHCRGLLLQSLKTCLPILKIWLIRQNRLMGHRPLPNYIMSAFHLSTITYFF